MRIDDGLQDRIQAWLQQTYAMKRPPTTAAAVLSLILKLHTEGKPFPTRGEVAEMFNCSVFGVDAALNQAMARGLIEQKVDVSGGNVQRRESVVRHRYYVPQQPLLLAAGFISANASKRANVA